MLVGRQLRERKKGLAAMFCLRSVENRSGMQSKAEGIVSGT